MPAKARRTSPPADDESAFSVPRVGTSSIRLRVTFPPVHGAGWSPQHSSTLRLEVCRGGSSGDSPNTRVQPVHGSRQETSALFLDQLVPLEPPPACTLPKDPRAAAWNAQHTAMVTSTESSSSSAETLTRLLRHLFETNSAAIGVAIFSSSTGTVNGTSSGSGISQPVCLSVVLMAHGKDKASLVILDTSSVSRVPADARPTATATATGAHDLALAAEPWFIPEATTLYDQAINETGLGSVEAALSAFDAQVNSSLLYSRRERFVNQAFLGGAVTNASNFNFGIGKQTASGASFAIRNLTDYNRNANPFSFFNSSYNMVTQLEFRQPLGRGRGSAVNRIAGPNATPGNYNGVLIARIRSDVSLADFEVAVRNLVRNVEDTYWELYFSYRDLDTKIGARDSAQEAWDNRKKRLDEGVGRPDDEALARRQYFNFQPQHKIF